MSPTEGIVIYDKENNMETHLSTENMSQKQKGYKQTLAFAEFP